MSVQVQFKAWSFLFHRNFSEPKRTAPAFLAFIHRARSPQKPPAKLTPSRRRIHLAKAAVFHQGGNLKCLRFDGIPNYFLVRWCDIAVIHSNLCVRFWDGKSPNTVELGLSDFKPTRRESGYRIAIFRGNDSIELEQISVHQIHPWWSHLIRIHQCWSSTLPSVHCILNHFDSPNKTKKMPAELFLIGVHQLHFRCLRLQVLPSMSQHTT